ncbi:hypothetical protein [Phaeocystidibacter luteus]|uniref:Uncharacterized protein n=1 Tax=Phaeocystidibacter luteus TaxID=911197 RepID=A0A6N6RHN4_9FLAO|nr:hypothetical protein [Phaeocystidibacter luteus]KAB2810267.1 hypothetical protein F8C67_06695 [Phaeocystidibacter luteus]
MSEYEKPSSSWIFSLFTLLLTLTLFETVNMMYQLFGISGDGGTSDALGVLEYSVDDLLALPTRAFYIGTFVFGIIGGWLSLKISPLLTSIVLILLGAGSLILSQSLNAELVRTTTFSLGALIPYCLHYIGQSKLKKHQLMAVSFSLVGLSTISVYLGFKLVEETMPLEFADFGMVGANFIGPAVLGVLLLGSLMLAYVRANKESRFAPTSMDNLGYLLASFSGYILIQTVLPQFSGEWIPNELFLPNNQEVLVRVQDSHILAQNVSAVIRAIVFLVFIFAVLRYKPSVAYFIHVLPRLFILKICFAAVGYMLSSSTVLFYMMIPNFILDMLILGGLISTILVSAWKTLGIASQWITYGLMAVPFIIKYSLINGIGDAYVYGTIGGVLISYSAFHLWKENKVEDVENIESEVR